MLLSRLQIFNGPGLRLRSAAVGARVGLTCPPRHTCTCNQSSLIADSSVTEQRVVVSGRSIGDSSCSHCSISSRTELVSLLRCLSRWVRYTLPGQAFQARAVPLPEGAPLGNGVNPIGCHASSGSRRNYTGWSSNGDYEMLSRHKTRISTLLFSYIVMGRLPLARLGNIYCRFHMLMEFAVIGFLQFVREYIFQAPTSRVRKAQVSRYKFGQLPHSRVWW